MSDPITERLDKIDNGEGFCHCESCQADAFQRLLAALRDVLDELDDAEAYFYPLVVAIRKRIASALDVSL